MIALEPTQLSIVKDILKKNLPTRRVVVFGSRAKHNSKQYSDLDLCVMGDTALTLKEMADLREDFSESDLPFRVDIVDWATTSPEFKAIIEASFKDI